MFQDNILDISAIDKETVFTLNDRTSHFDLNDDFVLGENEPRVPVF
jgi:hypothetical protein